MIFSTRPISVMVLFDPDRHKNILGVTDLDELNAQEALNYKYFIITR